MNNCEICKYKESVYEFVIRHTGTMMDKLVMEQVKSINICDECFQIKYPKHHAAMSVKD